MKSSKIVLLLLSLVFVFNLSGCSSKLTGDSDSSDNNIATVGSEKITNAEFRLFLNLVKTEAEAKENLTTDDAKKAYWAKKENATKLKDDTIDKLHEFKILLIKAKDDKYKLEQTDLDNVKSSIDQIVTSEGGGKREEADKKIKEKFGVNLTEYETIYKDYMLGFGKYASDLAKGITIKADETKAYYDKNIDKYKSEKATVQHVLILTQDQATGKEMDAAKVAEKQKSAEDILAKAKSGTDFASLAKQYSEDPGSKEKGGEYTFGKGEMVPEFENWAFSAKEGDMDIVKTTYGFHVMKFIKKFESTSTLEEVKSAIESQLKSDSLEIKLKGWKALPEYKLEKNQKAIDAVSI